MTTIRDDELDPYQLLGIGIEATEAEIKTAYRQRSLKVHPDRHPNNPDAAHKFHELNQAYELLLDPIRKRSLDAGLRTKLARQERFAKFDVKRKGMQTELEEAERAVKRAKMDRAKEERERKEETERIKEEGRRMREERQREINRATEIMKKKDEPPGDRVHLGPLDTTVRLKYSLSRHPALTTVTALCTLLSTFGPVDQQTVMISMKPPKKSPNGPPKLATVLVPFINVGDAYAAVSASGKGEKGLANIEVSWAAGKEPELLEKLIQRDRVDAKNQSRVSLDTSPSGKPFVMPQSHEALGGPSLSYPSPPSFSFDPSHLQTKSDSGGIPGLDYESITMMRLRKAERERLERELREQEAGN